VFLNGVKSIISLIKKQNFWFFVTITHWHSLSFFHVVFVLGVHMCFFHFNEIVRMFFSCSHWNTDTWEEVVLFYFFICFRVVFTRVFSSQLKISLLFACFAPKFSLHSKIFASLIQNFQLVAEIISCCAFFHHGIFSSFAWSNSLLINFVLFDLRHQSKSIPKFCFFSSRIVHHRSLSFSTH